MAFHPYPKLIRILFNGRRFGPPAPVTAPSAWPGVDRKVSRPPPPTHGPLRTRFRSGCGPPGPYPRRRRATRRLIMQKARRHHLSGSDRLWAHGFRYSFTPLPAVLFTFPSRYLCAIGLPGVLSLGGWCRRIRTGLLRPRPTQGPGWVGGRFRYGAVTLCGAPFQAPSLTFASSMTAALLPRPRLDADGLGSPPFARRYSGGHCCFPFLRLLGCFGSSGSPPHQGDAMPAHGGLPHSDTCGSTAVRASPQTFAACRVLRRLREPRHPPYALARFSLS